MPGDLWFGFRVGVAMGASVVLLVVNLIMLLS